MRATELIVAVGSQLCHHLQLTHHASAPVDGLQVCVGLPQRVSNGALADGINVLIVGLHVVVIIADGACFLFGEVEATAMVHWHKDVILCRNVLLHPVDVFHQSSGLVERHLRSSLILELAAELFYGHIGSLRGKLVTVGSSPVAGDIWCIAFLNIF